HGQRLRAHPAGFAEQRQAAAARPGARRAMPTRQIPPGWPSARPGGQPDKGPKFRTTWPIHGMLMAMATRELCRVAGRRHDGEPALFSPYAAMFDARLPRPAHITQLPVGTYDEVWLPAAHIARRVRVCAVGHVERSRLGCASAERDDGLQVRGRDGDAAA